MLRAHVRRKLEAFSDDTFEEIRGNGKARGALLECPHKAWIIRIAQPRDLPPATGLPRPDCLS